MLSALECLELKQYLEMFLMQHRLFRVLMKFLKRKRHKKKNWFLPIMVCTMNELRMLSVKADIFCMSTSHASRKLINYKTDRCIEKAHHDIMNAFRYCATDMRTKPEVSKRNGMLAIANIMIRIYIRIHKINLSKAVIRAIDHLSFMDRFPRTERATYYYFCAKRAMYYDDLPTAEKYFQYAFDHGDSRCPKNMRMILQCLVPLKILHGKYPKRSVLSKYGLTAFIPFCAAVSNGNVGGLLAFQEDNYQLFLDCHMHMVMRHLLLYTLRNLIKKCAAIMKSTRVKVWYVLKGLEISKAPMPQDEFLNTVAYLIFKKRIKGYVSTKWETIVILRRDFPNAAFPEY